LLKLYYHISYLSIAFHRYYYHHLIIIIILYCDIFINTISAIPKNITVAVITMTHLSKMIFPEIFLLLVVVHSLLRLQEAITKEFLFDHSI